jgi:stage III sporulation protein AD
MNGELIKILGICIVTAALCVTVKPKAAEYSVLISVAAGIIISLILIKIIAPAIKSFNTLTDSYGIKTEYLSVAIKALGIGYLTSFIADSCRDSGQQSLAAKAEFAGKCAIFILSLPLLLSVLETAVGFIK